MRRDVLNKHRQIIGFLDIDGNFTNAFSIKKGWVGRYSKNTDIPLTEMVLCIPLVMQQKHL